MQSDINIHTECGNVEAEIDALEGCVTVRFGISYTLSMANPDHVLSFADLLRSAATRVKAQSAWEEVPIEQLQWYVACCIADVIMDDPGGELVRCHIVEELLGKRVSIMDRSKEELIADASSFNESSMDALERLQKSVLRAPPGWPMYSGPLNTIGFGRNRTGDDDGGGS